MAKKALITGITGQDGSYLAELLLEKKYEVYGIIRRASTFNTERIDSLYRDPHNPNNRMHLIYGDLTDSSSINKVIREVKPSEIYNLGAQSHVRVSVDTPENTCDITGMGALRLLESLRQEGMVDSVRFYQASSSEMFGSSPPPQNEKTAFHPRSPYACAKEFAFSVTRNYRESFKMFACNGILFNHESPRRGKTFVTKKITRAAARISAGVEDCLYLGNLESKRDWGHAKDYVYAMWLMMQKDKPEDYVIATGESHSVREFLYESFRAVGIELISNGKQGIEEVLARKDTLKPVVRIDSKYFRPAEVDYLLGDPTKARTELGWKPTIFFKDLVREMVESDVKELNRELNGVRNA